MTEQALWSDGAILKAVAANSVQPADCDGADAVRWFVDSGVAYNIACQVRDDYQAALAAVQQERDTLHAVAISFNEFNESFGKRIDALKIERDALRESYIALLDVAIARGVQLGYEDVDYHKRYESMAGVPWRDDEGADDEQ